VAAACSRTGGAAVPNVDRLAGRGSARLRAGQPPRRGRSRCSLRGHLQVKLCPCQWCVAGRAGRSAGRPPAAAAPPPWARITRGQPSRHLPHCTHTSVSQTGTDSRCCASRTGNGCRGKAPSAGQGRSRATSPCGPAGGLDHRRSARIPRQRIGAGPAWICKQAAALAGSSSAIGTLLQPAACSTAWRLASTMRPPLTASCGELPSGSASSACCCGSTSPRAKKAGPASPC